MRKRSELLISVFQIPVDYVMLVASFVLAYFVRQGSGKPFYVSVGGYTYLNYLMLFLPLWLGILRKGLCLDLDSYYSINVRLEISQKCDTAAFADSKLTYNPKCFSVSIVKVYSPTYTMPNHTSELACLEQKPTILPVSVS